jgi:hypothetical protein
LPAFFRTLLMDSVEEEDIYIKEMLFL